jgi:SAM-dependent methyltransferase
MSEVATRACEICGGRDVTPLHLQKFTLPGIGLGTLRYRVCVCDGCGFVYADDIPSPSDYERYYRGNQKYTYEGSKNVPRGLFAIHEAIFRTTDDFLAREAGANRHELKLVDVGCATGHLLSFFRKAGYGSLRGVDPAPECRTIGGQLYGIDIQTASLHDFREGGWKVMLLSSVLEHLPRLSEATRHLASLVEPGGFLVVQLPDAGSFGANLREPFLEFSIEHVNYFTRGSLRNLLGGAGFAERHHQVDLLDNQGSTFPAITSIWEKTGAPAAVEKDPVGRETVSRYVERSTAVQKKIESQVDALIATKEEIAVWGTGSLTARLLATTKLGAARIATFVDSNPALQGKTLEGVPISAPASLRGRTIPVLIASYVYAAEIRRTLEDDLGYRGKIVDLP